VTIPPFDLDAIRGETFVADVVYHDTLDSTNDLAHTIAADGSPDPGSPVLFLAAYQTRGRGRGSNSWHAARGGLTFSLLLGFDNPIQPSRFPPLALATALGVSRALSSRLAEVVSDVRLKWPNDLVVNDRKICGILVEPFGGPSPGVIIGVGVNVNNRLDPSLENHATSLADLLGNHVPLTDLLIEILSGIEQTTGAWQNGDPTLAADWTRSCHDIDRPVVTETPRGPIEGICRGIDSDGRLILDLPNGSRQAIASGSLHFRERQS
jgi:BirA family biotin operon repressor/biotin-[acetyl-CoA-carboxylase] ligase